MADLKWTKVRNFIGAVVALVLVVVLAAAITVVADVEVPGLTNLAEMLGIDKLKS